MFALGLILGLMLGACGMAIQARMWNEDSHAKAKTNMAMRKQLIELIEANEREKAVNELLRRVLERNGLIDERQQRFYD